MNDNKEEVPGLCDPLDFVDSPAFSLPVDGEAPRPRSFKNKREVPYVLTPWQLSSMEYAVMDRMREGMTQEQVSKDLALSPKTVSTYCHRARIKMAFSETPVTPEHGCVLLDRFLRSHALVPKNFAVLVEVVDGKLTSRVIE